VDQAKFQTPESFEMDDRFGSHFIIRKALASNMPTIFGNFCLLILVCRLCSPLPAQGSTPRASAPEGQSPQQMLAVIDSLMTANELVPALELARQFHDRYAEDPRHGGAAQARLGVLLLRSGQPREALDPLENAIRQGPDRPEYHRNLGAALLALGRRGRALSEYRQAVQMDPKNHRLHLELGQLLLEFGDHNRAAGPLQTARHLCGDCPEVQEPLARLYLAQRDPASALPLLRALWAERQDREIRRNLVQAMQQAGQDSSLLVFLGSLDPRSLEVDEVQLMAGLEGRLGRWRLSAGWAAGDLPVPDQLASAPDFWGQVSYNLLLAEQNMAALKAADRALALDPENVTYLNNKVVLLLRLGREDEAHQQWQRVLELDPSLEEKNP
jgi:Flp pilus assembly protein TadD